MLKKYSFLNFIKSRVIFYVESKHEIDLESIGLKWSGPAIRPGLDNRNLIIEGHRGLRRSWKVMESHGRSRKVKEGHGWSFPITGLTLQMRKVIGGVVGW